MLDRINFFSVNRIKDYQNGNCDQKQILLDYNLFEDK